MPQSKLTPLAKALRQNQTRYERKLWKQLAPLKKDGFHFRRQSPIGNYIVDFVCHSANLIIELDGGHHGSTEQRIADIERQDWLESQGYQVLRFPDQDVHEDVESVARYIQAVLTGLTEHTPPLTPPHQGEGDDA